MGCRAVLPFSQGGVLIEKTPTYIRIKAKLGLVAIWNEDDSFLKPLCEQVLSGPAFSSCYSLLDGAAFTSACVTDLCNCANGIDGPAEPSCLCNTVSEFSRQCSHAGGKPENWRTKELCCE
ncbi:Mucin-5B [Liparis tanakae]|uniref:Mucin-5B n=1 Tax=Liparis tanakae TaxID=230148 RepID=A0A4Z2ETR3_9TELE|nr:Mucin-5B [Liparis tanakae]